MIDFVHVTPRLARWGCGWAIAKAMLLATVFGLAAVFGRSTQLDAQQAPVHATLTVAPTIVRPGDTVTMRLTLAIADGWYVYRTPGSAGQHKLALTSHVPAGVEPIDAWIWPKSEEVSEGTVVEIYQGISTFVRQFRVMAVPTMTDTVTFDATIHYQACNAHVCGPPTTVVVSTTLHVLPAVPTPKRGAGIPAPPALPSDSIHSARALHEDTLTQRVLALVGHAVPAPLVAPHWLNAARGTTRADLNMPATLVEFTWPGCGDCVKGYPTLRRLAERYGDRGLRIVFISYLFGSTPDHDSATVTQELAYDQRYWRVAQGLPFPIGILDRPRMNGFPPLFDSYAVTGAPTYYLIDRHGVVCAVQRGHRVDLAAWLTADIVSLLRTK